MNTYDADKLAIHNPGELLKMLFDRTRNIMADGLIAKGQPSTIVGPSGVGKSRLLLQMAVCGITGRDFIGWPMKQEKAKWLIIQAENSSHRLQQNMKRFAQWLGYRDWKLVEKYLRITPDDMLLNLNEPSNLKRIGRTIVEEEPAVVVFDPLNAFGIGSLNTDAGMINTCQELAHLSRLGDPGAALIILHHTLTGKQGIKKAVGWDKASYSRGSKALHAWTRGQINVAPGDEHDVGKLVIACGKNSNGPEFKPFGIILNQKSMVYEVDDGFDVEEWKANLAGESAPSHRPTSANITQFLTVPVRKSKLVDLIMEEYGCQKSNAYKVIAAAEGRTIKRNAQGRYEAM
jgi:hypothetical protein